MGPFQDCNEKFGGLNKSATWLNYDFKNQWILSDAPFCIWCTSGSMTSPHPGVMDCERTRSLTHILQLPSVVITLKLHPMDKSTEPPPHYTYRCFSAMGALNHPWSTWRTRFVLMLMPSTQIMSGDSTGALQLLGQQSYCWPLHTMWISTCRAHSVTFLALVLCGWVAVVPQHFHSEIMPLTAVHEVSRSSVEWVIVYKCL